MVGEKTLDSFPFLFMYGSFNGGVWGGVVIKALRY